LQACSIAPLKKAAVIKFRQRLTDYRIVKSAGCKMNGTGDFLQGVTAIAMFPKKIFFRVKQQVTVVTEIFEHVLARAVRAHRLRGQFPFRGWQPLRFERPIGMAAVKFDDLKCHFTVVTREQLELDWIGHGIFQLDLRSNKAASAVGEYPVASKPQRIASRACSLVARNRSIKTVTIR
jgi:hypothetical protein